MCRLFAQLSVAPRTAEGLLVDSDKSLLEQSRAKKSCLQRDGWGLGWHDAKGRVRVEKSANPIYRERSKLVSAAEAAEARIVVAHVRAASNPLKLDNSRLLTVANNQPFTDGRWLFIHNGTLSIPRETAAALGRLKSKLKAENDSEVWFYHLLKHLERAGSFHEAAASAIAELWDIWARCKGDHPGLNQPYTALNCMLTDGEELHALCHQAARGMALFGACSPDQPWGQMSFSRRAGRLIVASEDMDGGAWTRMAPPETLTARIREGRVELERRALKGVPQAALPQRKESEAVR